MRRADGFVRLRLLCRRELASQRTAWSTSPRGSITVQVAESKRNKPQGGIAARRASYSVVRFSMEDGTKRCEVAISGKMAPVRPAGKAQVSIEQLPARQT